VVDKVPVEQGFLQYFAFPNQLSFQQRSTIINIRAKDMGPTQVEIPQCHSCTPSDPGSCPVATFQTLRSDIRAWSVVTCDIRTCSEYIPNNQTVYLHKDLQNIYNKGKALQWHTAVGWERTYKQTELNMLINTKRLFEAIQDVLSAEFDTVCLEQLTF